MNPVRRFLLGSLATVTLAMPTVSRACDLCSMSNALIAQNHEGFSLGLSNQYTRFGTLAVDGHPIANEQDQFLRSSVSQVQLGYSRSSRLGLQLVVPILRRSYRRVEGDGTQTGTVSGLGDLSLVATGTVYGYDRARTALRLRLLGGIKLPTGATDRLGEEAGEADVAVEARLVGSRPAAPAHEGHEAGGSGVHGHDLTLGSGSVDGTVGFSAYARRDRFFTTIATQYAIRTKGDHDYRFANDLSLRATTAAYVHLRHGNSVAVGLDGSGETKPNDTSAGVKADDTALTAFYLGPTVQATYRDLISAEITLALPVYRHNTALQSLPDTRLRTQFSYRF